MVTSMILVTVSRELQNPAVEDSFYQSGSHWTPSIHLNPKWEKYIEFTSVATWMRFYFS